MAADHKNERGAACALTDQVGKVFLIVGQRVRQCLVCEELFTRRTAFEHLTVQCMPRINTKARSK